jgi:hypothetical protein
MEINLELLQQLPAEESESQDYVKCESWTTCVNTFDK